MFYRGCWASRCICCYVIRLSRIVVVLVLFVFLTSLSRLLHLVSTDLGVEGDVIVRIGRCNVVPPLPQLINQPSTSAYGECRCPKESTFLGSGVGHLG